MHTSFLQQALELAQIRRGFCAPNPAVGALVVKNQQIIAQGYHLGSGHPHAEAEALRKLDSKAKGSTLYVTLEPCCHRNKKTPPCTDLLIKNGIKQVIYGFRDPNPEVDGKSEEILRAAGIQCSHFPVPAINVFYQSYARWWQHKLPAVTAKLALTLDGKIAGRNGQRITITGSEAQHFTHQQRLLADAILTTAKTIIADNPLLNVRLADKQYSKPLYILDRQLKTPLHATVFSTATNVTLFYSSSLKESDKIKAYKEQGARCIPVNSDSKGLILNEVLAIIGQDGIHDLWVEAGGTCFSAFINENLLQSAFVYVAPKLLGPDAQNAFAVTSNIFSKATNYHWEKIGQDAVCKISW